MSNFDDLKLSVEAISGGKNTVILDDAGMPSFMVMIPKLMCSALITGGSEYSHPAFISGNTEYDKVYISKYINVVKNGRAYSLPMQDPAVGNGVGNAGGAKIDFDGAVSVCRAKGEGWGLTPFALYGAIALWCRKNGTIPHGNNYYGKDIDYPHETGVATFYDGDNIGRTATGSGPVTWYHDHSPNGIADLNGNVNEWTAGLRVKNGVLQFVPNADCMQSDCDMGETSAFWKENGTFSGTDYGTSSIGADYVFNGIVYKTAENITKESTARESLLKNVTSDLASAANTILKLYGLLPEDVSESYGNDIITMNNGIAEGVAIKGGTYARGRAAGIFSTNLSYLRTSDYRAVGFRSAYYGDI
ncbi:MAG: hypothetical protein Q4D26_09595 [Clostridia bacterium]|nr:hypothetical protein [Clostridia bacterium]